VSALAGTDLEMVLRANAIETLVLARIATSGGRAGYIAAL
jgi:nicotinamidase-related amidase